MNRLHPLSLIFIFLCIALSVDAQSFKAEFRYNNAPTNTALKHLNDNQKRFYELVLTGSLEGYELEREPFYHAVMPTQQTNTEKKYNISFAFSAVGKTLQFVKIRKGNIVQEVHLTPYLTIKREMF